jgi:hypothetical protein
MWARGGAWITVLGAALAIGFGVPAASAATVSFGTNLEQPANAPLSCSEGVLNQFLGKFIIGPFGGSCMWTSVVVGSSSESLTAPASGTVTAVRVKMGPSTGPMQITVVRFLFRQTGNPATPELACCFVEAYGPVFTPTANAVTTVATDLPVKVEPTPPPDDTTTIAATDQLALSSLDPNVQVPLFATKNGENDLSVLSYAWYPAPTTGTVPAPSPNPIGGSADLSGFKVLMSADLDTGGGGGGATGGGGGGGGGAPGAGAPAGGGPPAGTAAPVPAISLPKLTIPVRGGTATVPLQCLVVNCNGTVTLQNARPAGLARAAAAKSGKPKLVSYGTASFVLKAGTTGKIKVKLNGAGRALFRRGAKAVKVWANVHFTSGGGASKSMRVTLKR